MILKKTNVIKVINSNYSTSLIILRDNSAAIMTVKSLHWRKSSKERHHKQEEHGRKTSVTQRTRELVSSSQCRSQARGKVAFRLSSSDAHVLGRESTKIHEPVNIMRIEKVCCATFSVPRATGFSVDGAHDWRSSESTRNRSGVGTVIRLCAKIISRSISIADRFRTER